MSDGVFENNSEKYKALLNYTVHYENCTLGVLAIIAAASNRMEQIDVPVSYFDAKTKKGKVKLHTGMPKDSVLLLAGEPDEFRSTTIQGHNMEHAGYKISNRYVADLEFTFIDGEIDIVIGQLDRFALPVLLHDIFKFDDCVSHFSRLPV